MTGQPLVVAIDGTSGVGKSTVARRLAVALDVPYLETGAMYRALGLKVDQMGVDPANREIVEALASDLDLELRRNPDGTVEVLLDGRRLGEEARQPSRPIRASAESWSHTSDHSPSRLARWWRDAISVPRSFPTRRTSSSCRLLWQRGFVVG